MSVSHEPAGMSMILNFRVLCGSISATLSVGNTVLPPASVRPQLIGTTCTWPSLTQCNREAKCRYCTIANSRPTPCLECATHIPLATVPGGP